MCVVILTIRRAFDNAMTRRRRAQSRCTADYVNDDAIIPRRALSRYNDRSDLVISFSRFRRVRKILMS